MSGHRYKVGQQVRPNRGFFDRTGTGVYEVVRLLPESPNGDLHYRVKGPDKIERAVTEDQLDLVGDQPG